jgi:hypothetical protein
MKAYGGSEGIAPCILNLGTDGGEWSASRPGRFTPRERDPGTHWIGDWVGPKSTILLKDNNFSHKTITRLSGTTNDAKYQNIDLSYRSGVLNAGLRP